MAQERVSRAGHAVLKWVASIAGSVITGVLLWQLTDGPPAPTPQNPTEENEPAPPAVACHVDGAVYDKDTNQPIAAIQVHYYRRDPNTGMKGVLTRLATTAPDGRFSADCSSIEAEYFPLHLELVGPNWRAPYQTNEYVRHGETRHDVYIYVSDRLLRQSG